MRLHATMRPGVATPPTMMTRRHSSSSSAVPDSPEPRRLDHVRATHVRGQCHSNFDCGFGANERKMHDWFENGFQFRPIRLQSVEKPRVARGFS